ncbi:unnamed protein product [Linum tenue]|uniref:Knottins-like domain-containing protein n=3 Tax=Linum tenue TaxID=586396 RepID=A0AAV0J5T9_9ROSI|nr:unnamed protein product [Linum tenue]
MAKISSRPCSLFVLLLLIFMVSHEEAGMVKVAEARVKVCATQSRYFKGGCRRDHNCAMVCRDEGFSGGRCTKPFSRPRRHCFCTKFC